MTLAERLRREGRTIGKAEGKIEAAKEIAENFLAKGIDPSMVAQATGLSLEIIAEMQGGN